MIDESSLNIRERWMTPAQFEHSSPLRAAKLATRSAKAERRSADLAASCDPLVVTKHRVVEINVASDQMIKVPWVGNEKFRAGQGDPRWAAKPLE